MLESQAKFPSFPEIKEPRHLKMTNLTKEVDEKGSTKEKGLNFFHFFLLQRNTVHNDIVISFHRLRSQSGSPPRRASRPPVSTFLPPIQVESVGKGLGSPVGSQRGGGKPHRAHTASSLRGVGSHKEPLTTNRVS